MLQQRVRLPWIGPATVDEAGTEKTALFIALWRRSGSPEQDQVQRRAQGRVHYRQPAGAGDLLLPPADHGHLYRETPGAQLQVAEAGLA